MHSRSSKAALLRGWPLTILVLAFVATSVSACSSEKSPLAPSPATDPPAPPPVTTTFTVSGRVVDRAAEAPLVAARVEIARGDAAVFEAETDAAGSYHIDNVTAGEYSMRAWAEGFDPSSMAITIAENKIVDLALVRTGTHPEPPSSDTRWTLSGVVKDTVAGSAVRNARVEVVTGDQANVGRAATTGIDGSFVLADLVGGTLTVRASAEGYVTKSTSVTLQAPATIDVLLERATPPGPSVSGRVMDVLTDVPLAGITVKIEGGGEAVTDESGAFAVAGIAGDFQRVTLVSPETIERRTYVQPSGSDALTLIPRSLDLRSLDEMLRTRGGLHRWVAAPRVVIERRVLVFTNTSDMTYTAAADVMSEAEASELAADLAWALPRLSGGVFGGFAGVDVELATEGEAVAISRADTIIVARYQGLHDAIGALGYGRWAWNAAGEVRAGALMLDDTFDRTGAPYRRSLRAHELGHTLGYDHVSAPVSAMHASGHIEPTAFDRDATRIAFRRRPLNQSPDIDPDPGLSQPSSTRLSWAGSE